MRILLLPLDISELGGRGLRGGIVGSPLLAPPEQRGRGRAFPRASSLAPPPCFFLDVLHEEFRRTDVEDKLPMKRKGRSPAGKEWEACGVWLDTSALKRRKLQSLIGKPALRRLSPTSSYSAPEKVYFPCTKQTTLSTFFRTLQAEEGGTNTNKSLLLVTTNSPSDVKAPQLPAWGETPLPSSAIQPVATEKRGQQQVEKPQHGLPGDGPAVQAQRDSCLLNSIQEEPSAEERDPFSSDRAQPWKEKRALDYVSEPPLRERNGDWKKEKIPSSSFQSPPKRKVVFSKRTKLQRSYTHPSCDSENVDPQLEDRETQTKPSGSCRGSRPALFLEAGDPLRTANNGAEDSQGEVGSSLFTQDSQGYRVISHRFLLDQDMSEESCYDLLFTEDSEGNKIIKH
ncbi:hypothetical protein JRQ81_011867 [Phrynocephalus forsythii]|uniref:Aurora kinase A and ninein-interacting protein n=1 Tax=Phrynocephalus forsythii TaxID=171643 RepID=A0A9Q1AQE9_9SAUR|nr:hypothetical protein JRQ81_011867 [Phrynocephalus forsythii]